MLFVQAFVRVKIAVVLYCYWVPHGVDTEHEIFALHLFTSI